MDGGLRCGLGYSLAPRSPAESPLRGGEQTDAKRDAKHCARQRRYDLGGCDAETNLLRGRAQLAGTT